jgi:hypothetical protein
MKQAKPIERKRVPKPKKTADLDEILRQELAARVLAGKLIYTKAGIRYKLLSVDEDQTERWDSESRGTVIAHLINYRGTKIPGRGKSKEEAVLNALLHLETQGSKILYTEEEVQESIKPVPEKKKKGIPFV